MDNHLYVLFEKYKLLKCGYKIDIDWY